MASRIPKDAYVMIIGAMKCGTSSLYSYLRSHPEICPARIKEPEFFSEHQRHGIEVTDYSDLWSFDNSIHKYVLEASTGYTKYPFEPHVPRNIFNYDIHPKFIYIIRNPFDRIASHFNYMSRYDSWSSSISGKHLIYTSNYSLQLDQYMKYFPRDNFLILDFDDLKNDPEGLLKTVYRFLNLSNFHFPREYNPKNRTPLQSHLEKHLKNLTIIRTFRDYIPQPIKYSIKSLVHKVSPPAKRVLTEKEKNLLYKELKEGMACLRYNYGFDVSKWGFDV